MAFWKLCQMQPKLLWARFQALFSPRLFSHLAVIPQKKNIHMHPPVSHMLRLRVSVC